VLEVVLLHLPADLYLQMQQQCWLGPLALTCLLAAAAAAAAWQLPSAAFQLLLPPFALPASPSPAQTGLHTAQWVVLVAL
jgi:hypothetical protein